MIEEQRAEHTLAASTNLGRYALDRAGGRDITSGDRIAIWLGGWIDGTVEFGNMIYAVAGAHYGVDFHTGYYFLADGGGTCGLCTGMRVRVPS